MASIPLLARVLLMTIQPFALFARGQSTSEPLHAMTSGGASDPRLSPGVSVELAEHRSRILSDIRYELHLSIPDSAAESILGRATIRFRLASTEAPLILDFRQPADRVRSVRAGGGDVRHDHVNGHVLIDRAGLRTGENEIEIDFVAGDEALNRSRDYLYTLFVPDRAAVTFPSFDQPGLKGRYRLTLEAPADWVAVANGALVQRTEHGSRAVHVFAETQPLPTYLFAFATGDFQVETAVREGREMRMYHRETDASRLERNREGIFDLHAAALSWLEAYTGILYPFGKFDFVAIPSFQFGGMEHPGAILYNAGSLMLEESATQAQHLGRASLIAHEAAHMWFGDLVTMRWFDDVWTKEVFANFMAAKIVNPGFPEVDHDLRFMLSHYPAAYEIDRTAGANPIRQELENLLEAGSLYGAIIYQKAPIVMRQLEAQMGEEAFRDGLREYLRSFAFGNSSWPELIAILDRRTPEDLAGWSHVWVEEAGRPVVETHLGIRDGRISSLALSQTDPAGRGRVWPQSLEVLIGYDDSVRRVPLRMSGGEVEVSEAIGLPAPRFVLADGRGMAYGLFVPDAGTLEWLTVELPMIPEPLIRGIGWITLWDAMLEGRVEPTALLDLASRSLPAEKEELNIQRILGYQNGAFWRHIDPPERDLRAPALEALLWDSMERAETAGRKSAFFSAYRSIALSAPGVARLERVWRRELEVPGLVFGEPDFTAMALELAVREVPGWRAILDEQQRRLENPDRRERFAFVAPALSADPSERDNFFAGLRSPAGRQREAWVLEGLSYLHHPLRAAGSAGYVLPSLEMLGEIQTTGDIFFPKRWLDVTLSGHRSPAVAATVRSFLERAPDLPPRLRGKLLQTADELFRIAARAEPGG